MAKFVNGHALKTYLQNCCGAELDSRLSYLECFFGAIPFRNTSAEGFWTGKKRTYRFFGMHEKVTRVERVSFRGVFLRKRSRLAA